MQNNYTNNHKVELVTQSILENVSRFCIDSETSELRMAWSVDNLALLQDTPQFPFMIQYGEHLINIILSNLGFNKTLNTAGMLVHNLKINKQYKKYGLVNALTYIIKQDIPRVQSLYIMLSTYNEATVEKKALIDAMFYPLPITTRDKPKPPIIKPKNTTVLDKKHIKPILNPRTKTIPTVAQIKSRPIPPKPKNPQANPIQLIATTTRIIPDEQIIGNPMAQAFMKHLDK
jgi:hypothetical protein